MQAENEPCVRSVKLLLHAPFREQPASLEEVMSWRLVTNEREEEPTSSRKGWQVEKGQMTADLRSI